MTFFFIFYLSFPSFLHPSISPKMFQFSSLIVLLLIFTLWSQLARARLTPEFKVNPVAETTVKTSIHTWHKFERFLDLGRGSQVRGMSELKKYLHHFGYLPVRDMNFTDTFDARFEHAVNRYQSNFGLPITGKLDFDTLSQLMSPRCGVPDRPINSQAIGVGHYAYFTGQPRWARTMPITLTYAFSPEHWDGNLSLSDVKDVFKRAFGHWASIIPVSFEETVDYGFADIKIGFYVGDHGDGEPFDGVLGVLAHAFSPESGSFHLDAAETWALDLRLEKSKVAVDLESVATHEIGHLLGLAHTSVKEAVMYPSLKPRHRKVDLKLDDVEAIQALYGSNPNFRWGELAESDTSSNDGVDFRIRSTTWYTLMLLLTIINV